MRAAASKGAGGGLQRRSRSRARRPRPRRRRSRCRPTRIIYELSTACTAMEDLLEPIRTEKKLGRAEVRNTLQRAQAGHHRRRGGARRRHQARARSCACCARTSRSSPARWPRSRRFKDDVKEVAQGFECGIGIENFNDLKAGRHHRGLRDRGDAPEPELGPRLPSELSPLVPAARLRVAAGQGSRHVRLRRPPHPPDSRTAAR